MRLSTGWFSFHTFFVVAREYDTAIFINYFDTINLWQMISQASLHCVISQCLPSRTSEIANSYDTFLFTNLVFDSRLHNLHFTLLSPSVWRLGRLIDWWEFLLTGPLTHSVSVSDYSQAIHSLITQLDSDPTNNSSSSMGALPDHPQTSTADR